jgi:hypothetical protein
MHDGYDDHDHDDEKKATAVTMKNYLFPVN